MRTLLVALVVVAPLLALPGASAAASLGLDAPAGVVQLAAGEPATMPLHVRVRLEDAACPEGATLRVRLGATPPAGVRATLPEEVTLQVPPGFYLREDYVGEAEARLTLVADAAGAGQVALHATLLSTPDCTVMGQDSADALAYVSFQAVAPGQPSPQAPTPAAPEPSPQEAPAPSPRPLPPSRPTPAEAPLAREAPAPLSSRLVVPILGVAVIGVIFYALGRLGGRERLGRDDERF